MKKPVVVSLVIVILFVIFLIPVTRKTHISISATFDNTIGQVIHLDNWKNWYPEIKAAYKKDPAGYSLVKDIPRKTFTFSIPGKKLIVHAITPTSFQVNEISGHLVHIFGFSVTSTDTAGKMEISLIKKVPLLFILFNKNKSGENALYGLKSFLEDPKAFYGFNIELAEIRDPVVASKVFKISKRDLFSKIQAACLDLEAYIKMNNLIKTNHTDISYIPIPGDSLELTVGFPVNKQAPPAKGISCLLMPAKGRVVVAPYNGKFSDRHKIYFAVAKYLSDHALSAVAESFERYLNDSIPSSDSSVIRIEFDSPVR